VAELATSIAGLLEAPDLSAYAELMREKPTI